MANIKILFVFFLLVACKNNVVSTACPDIPFYSLEEQREINRIRKEVNNIILDKFLIDYGNLRENLRICKNK